MMGKIHNFMPLKPKESGEIVDEEALTIVGIGEDNMTKVHAELTTPDGDPANVVGAEMWRKAENYVLHVTCLQPGHLRISVVVELALERMREDDTLPRAWNSISSNPEESIRTSSIITKVLYQQFVLFRSEIHSSTNTMQCGLELPQEPLDRAEGGGLLARVVFRTWIVGARRHFLVLPVTVDSPRGRGVRQKTISPSLSSDTTGEGTLTPVTPGSPLTFGSKT